MKHLSIRDLENAAGMLSNYNGDLVDFNGINDARAEMNYYDGSQDDLVDFEGGTGIDETNLKTERIFRVTVTNPLNTRRKFSIGGGLDFSEDSKSTLLVQGVANTTSHGVIIGNGFIYAQGETVVEPADQATCLLVTGEPTNYSNFRRYFERNPTRVLGFKVASNVASQMEEIVDFRFSSPFRTQQSRTIYLSNYQNENTFQDKQVTVPESFQLDSLTRTIWTIVGNSSMTITFYCGASLNVAKGLDKKYMKAKSFNTQRYAYNNLTQKRGLIGG